MRSWCTATTFILLACLLLLPDRASAQQGLIAGTVVASGSQEPLAGATVGVTGQFLRTTTDEQGRFRLANISGTSVTVEVRRIGYKIAKVPARVGDENIRVVLTLNPTSLEAVVVTGTAGAVEKREI